MEKIHRCKDRDRRKKKISGEHLCWANANTLPFGQGRNQGGPAGAMAPPKAATQRQENI
jgi:hypothetical protein